MKITENLLKKISFNLYKIDWLRQHISTERMLSAYKEFAVDTFWYDDYNHLGESELEEILTLENFLLSGVSSVGINGECYVCFEEFLQSEYKDIHYMSYLLKDSEFWDIYKELYGVSDDKADEPTLDYAISESVVRLFQAFPNAYLNHLDEFIADKNTNQY
ncbi:MAG: hypothetical protein IJT36_01545 [Alphaproteobacteria bacterium]|nr:hypothetical protein [Alphaproteobacteria bacterium]